METIPEDTIARQRMLLELQGRDSEPDDTPDQGQANNSSQLEQGQAIS